MKRKEECELIELIIPMLEKIRTPIENPTRLKKGTQSYNPFRPVQSSYVLVRFVNFRIIKLEFSSVYQIFNSVLITGAEQGSTDLLRDEPLRDD